MSKNSRGLSGKAVAPGILLVFLTVLFSGVSNFVNAQALGANPAWNSDLFVTLRNVAVAAMLVPLVFLAGRTARAPLTRTDWLKLGAIGLIGGAIPFLLFFRGLQIAGAAGAATATFGYRALFLMAAVLGVVFLKEHLTSRLALAAVLLLAGNALLISLTAPIWTDGTAYVLLATALWAGEYTLSKHALRNLPSGTVALGRMGFGGVFLFAYVALTGQLGGVAAIGGAQWGWIALSVVLLLGFVTTWYAGLKTVDVSVATAALVLAFPITWALGLLASKSTLGLPQLAGVVAITLGVALAIGLASLRETWEAVRVWLRARISRAE
ncbi:MAG TPA: DMT family transporter [Thermoplasmata archaeon]|nr:DMT family transporter [Thermoplasmata archaeon]